MKSLRLWGWLAGLTLVTRLPFFFVDVIDWDESTFILMGKSLLDGFLPYTITWDNKPPAIFFLFAGLLSLPGNDVLIVRVSGALLVFVSALLVYALAGRISSHRAGMFAATVYILGMSATGSGQSTMSELISTVPVLAALLLLVAQREHARWYAAIGALLAIATLVRLNLAFVVMACGALIAVNEFGRGIKHGAQALSAYAAGGMGILALFMLPHVIDGSFPLFWYSVFEAPFRHATMQSGPVDNLMGHVLNAMGVQEGFDPPQFAIGLAVWLVAAPGIVLAARRSRGADPKLRTALAAVLVFAFATGFSVVVSGRATPHYLISLFPYASLFAGVTYAFLADHRLTAAAIAIVAISGLVMLRPVAYEYGMMWQRLKSGEPLMHGIAFEIADYLKNPCANGCELYLLEDHLAYVILDVYPPRRIVTHPSNIARPYLLNAEIGAEPTTEAELRAVLATRPDYIVKPETVWYLEDAPARILDEMLERRYRLVHTVQGRRIYQATDE